jgi:hypothetical protein
MLPTGLLEPPATAMTLATRRAPSPTLANGGPRRQEPGLMARTNLSIALT